MRDRRGEMPETVIFGLTPWHCSTIWNTIRSEGLVIEGEPQADARPLRDGKARGVDGRDLVEVPGAAWPLDASADAT